MATLLSRALLLAAVGAGLSTDARTAALIDAAGGGDMAEVKRLVEKVGVDPREYEGGRGPVHQAAGGGHLQIVKYLVEEQGVEADAADNDGRQPAHWAAIGGSLEVVKYLVEERGVEADAADNNGWQPLHWAATVGRLEVVKYLVEERGVEADAADNRGRQPVHYAAMGGSLEVLKYLVEERGVEADAADNDGWQPVHSAAKSGRLEVVKYFVEERGVEADAADNKGQQPVHYAAMSGSLGLVKYLVEERGAEADAADKVGHQPVHWAAEGGRLEVVKYLVEERGVEADAADKVGWQPVHDAAKSGSLEVVKYLVEERGVEADAADNKGWQPLHWAATVGSLEVVKYLVEERGVEADAADNKGQQPVHYAAALGSLEVVKYLVEERGAEADAADNDGHQPVHWAAKGGSLEVVKYLVEERGVEADAADNRGWQPLHYAAQGGSLGLVKYLVEERGVEADAADNDGHQPVHCAAKGGSLEVVKYLVAIQAPKVTAATADPFKLAFVVASCDSEVAEAAQYLLDHADYTAARGVTELMLAARYSTCKDLIQRLVNAGSCSFKRDWAGFTARQYAEVGGNDFEFLDALPQQSMTETAEELAHTWWFWGMVVGAVAVGAVASRYGSMQGRSDDEDANGLLDVQGRPQGPRAGAVKLAAQASLPGHRRHLILLARFIDVFATMVIPMRMMNDVEPWIWLPGIMLVHVIPACVMHGRGQFQLSPACWLVSFRASLHCVTSWSHAALLTVLVAVCRAAFVAVAWCLLLRWGELRNLNGAQALYFASSNGVNTSCVQTPEFVSTWQTPWYVEQGDCTVDQESSCLTSPGFPSPYSADETCAMTAGGFLWTVKINASDFETQDYYDVLTINGDNFSGSHAPNGIAPWGTMSWASDASVQKEGWQLCPLAGILCFWHPSVRDVWHFYEKFCKAVVGLWFAGVAGLLCALFCARCSQRMPSSPRRDIQQLAMEIESTIRDHGSDVEVVTFVGDLEGAEGHVKVVGKSAILTKIGFITLDFLLDLNTVCTMLLHQDVKFASMILWVTVASTVLEARSGGLRALRAAVRETLRTGVMSDGIQSIVDREAGMEALVSLLVTAYAFPFSATSSLKAISALLSIVTSTLSLAMYLTDRIDLAGLVDDLDRDSDTCDSSDGDSDSGSGSEAGLPSLLLSVQAQQSPDCKKLML